VDGVAAQSDGYRADAVPEIESSGVPVLARRIFAPEKRGFLAYAARFRACAAGPPQHFLYFAPERQGQGAFRGIFLLTAGCAGA
jgi:hypothetical protein